VLDSNFLSLVDACEILVGNGGDKDRSELGRGGIGPITPMAGSAIVMTRAGSLAS